ncbi:MAG: sugar phosphate isomerase/epimerase [Clostridia bacterium]|nr:sugar phosphate isomerase/epimerase [Clostridia bacterium]
MKFAMYTNFIELLLEAGTDKTADKMLSLGLPYGEVLDTAGPGKTPLLRDTDTAKQAGAALSARGISLACYSVGVNLYHDPESEKNLLLHAELAAAIGSPFLHHTLIPGLRPRADIPNAEEALETAAEAAVRIARASAPLGLTCLYEDQGMYANGVENFGKFYYEVRRVCPNVGVCGDMGNSLFVGTEPEDFFRAYAKEIRHVHVKDYLRKKSPEQPGIYWLPMENGKNQMWLRDVLTGDGTVNITGCMEVLREAGYDGVYALELCHPEPFDEGVRQSIRILERLA